MIRRNTIQRDLVLSAVRTLHCHATAEEIYNHIILTHPNIGKATVYRNLSILAEDGLIRKVQIPGQPDRFDDRCTEHYHVRCIKCARIFDVDMDAIPHLTDKIKDAHGMKFINYEILFNGICPDCQKEE